MEQASHITPETGVMSEAAGRGAPGREVPPEGVLINEIQLLLAEKRTSLATLRTGIAVFALPLSVLSLLVATSKYYEFSQVATLLLPLLALCAGLVVLGVYLIHRAVLKIHRYDRLVRELRVKNPALADLVD